MNGRSAHHPDLCGGLMEERGSDIYGIRLGHEELVYILGVLGARTLPGLEYDPLQGLDRVQREAVLGACERSLRARGLVRIDQDGGKVQVEQLVFALIGTCVYPKSTASLAIMEKIGNIDGRYYHRRDDLVVEHSFPEPGVHEFCAAADTEALAARVLGFVRLEDKKELDEEPFQIPVLGMEEILDRMRDGEWAGLARVLEEAGLEEDTVRRTHRLFQEATRCLVLARADFGDAPANTLTKSMAFLDGPSGLWAFFSDEKDPYMAQVQPWSLKEAEATILKYVLLVESR